MHTNENTQLSPSYIIVCVVAIFNLLKARGRFVGPPSLGSPTIPQGTTEGCICGEITCEVKRQLRRWDLITNCNIKQKSIETHRTILISHTIMRAGLRMVKEGADEEL